MTEPDEEGVEPPQIAPPELYSQIFSPVSVSIELNLPDKDPQFLTHH